MPSKNTLTVNVGLETVSFSAKETYIDSSTSNLSNTFLSGDMVWILTPESFSGDEVTPYPEKEIDDLFTKSGVAIPFGFYENKSAYLITSNTHFNNINDLFDWVIWKI